MSAKKFWWSSLKKPVLSGVAFGFAALVVSGGYVAWTALDRNAAASGQPLTSSMMQGVIDNLSDLNARLSSNFSFAGGNVTITKLTAPVNGTDAATKAYVDAATSWGGTPALGSDMLNNWAASQGLFNPHANNCAGTETFVPLYSGASVGFCIEKTERAAQTWENARVACAAAGKRLPEPWEWKYVCNNAGTLGVSTMTDNWEWASNFALPMYNDSFYGVSAAMFGGGGCAYASWDSVGYATSDEASHSFRCVR